MAKQAKSVSRRRANALRIAPHKTYRVVVAMTALDGAGGLRDVPIDHCCMPQPSPDADGVRRLHGYASGATVAALRKSGRAVKVLADAEVEGRSAQRYIGQGDRFEGGRRGPPGIGKLV